MLPILHIYGFELDWPSPRWRVLGCGG